MKRPRIIRRTIKDGKVRVFGRFFYPSSKYMEYDGRLDGLCYIFGLYYENGELLDKISLIAMDGKPTRFDPNNPDTYRENQPEVIDEYIPWLFWYPDVMHA